MVPAEEKVLRLLLSNSLGCDAVITAEAFQVQHGPRQWPTEYFPESIPGVIRQLLHYAGAVLPTTEARALLDPRDPESRLPCWLSEPRLLWLRADPEQIRIAVRSGAGQDADALVEWPEPLPVLVRGQRVYRELAEPFACPHCGTASRRYRQLIDASLVCGTCSRSFSHPIEQLDNSNR